MYNGTQWNSENFTNISLNMIFHHLNIIQEVILFDTY